MEDCSKVSFDRSLDKDPFPRLNFDCNGTSSGSKKAQNKMDLFLKMRCRRTMEKEIIHRLFLNLLILRYPVESSKQSFDHEDSDETELLSLKNLSLKPKKKLLVLNLHGLLLHRVHEAKKIRIPKTRTPDVIYGAYRAYKRPYSEEFMNFCLERFEVGIWTCARKENVNAALDIVMEGIREKLQFFWDQSMCTDTGFKSLEGKHKPLFFKDLNKVFHEFNKKNKTEFSALNTIFIDDEPRRTFLNPDNTSIFLSSYDPEDKEDNLLDPKGALCSYLDELANAPNVQTYIAEHHFGQPKIDSCHPDWLFYLNVRRHLYIRFPKNEISRTPNFRKEVRWVRPATGFFKLNTVGSSTRHPRSGAGGGVIRNSLGHWICGFAGFIGPTTVIYAKLWALRKGLILALKKQLIPISVEVDSKMVINLIRKADTNRHPLGEIIDDCRRFLANLPYVEISHVYREGNRVADRLAELGRSKSRTIFFGEPPPEIVKLLHRDWLCSAPSRFTVPKPLQISHEGDDIIPV